MSSLCHGTFTVSLLQLVSLTERHQDSMEGDSSQNLLIFFPVTLPMSILTRSRRMLESLLRPGVLGGNMGNYPWLADSWPTSNLVHGGKEAGNCCPTSQDTTERYYNGLSALVT